MVAVPGEAARVDLLISSDDGACSIEEGVAFVALLADTYRLVEVAALRGDLAASTLGVEEVALGAGHTDVGVPLGAAEVVVEGGQQGGVVGDEGLNSSILGEGAADHEEQRD